MKKKVMGLLLLLSVGIFCTQSFVVKKEEKPKKESTSQLKERVCHGLYGVLNAFSDILSALSSSQRAMLEALSGFVANEKKNLLDSATNEELKLLATQLEDIERDVQSLKKKFLQLSSSLSKK